jgi:dephospho-CoA kinase
MHQDKRPIIIGITGSIGSGKTKFCNYLEKGCNVYYTDELSHLSLNDIEIIKKLTNRWGDGILVNEVVSRAVIADIVFSNQAELRYLNSVIHPLVLEQMQDIVSKTTESVICFEVPLLFEVNLSHCFDYIVLITASEDIRIKRLIQQKQLSEHEAKARIKVQFSDSVKEKQSDMVIVNDSSEAELEAKAKALLGIIPYINYKEIVPFNEVNIQQ